jgi:hypothetical protein
MLVIGHELPWIYQEEAPWSDEADHLLGEVALPYPYFCAGASPGKVAEEEVPAIVAARPWGEEMASYAEAVRGVWIDACLMPVFPADMQAAFIHDAEDFALPARAACTGRDYSSWLELQVNSQ